MKYTEKPKEIMAVKNVGWESVSQVSELLGGLADDITYSVVTGKIQVELNLGPNCSPSTIQRSVSIGNYLVKKSVFEIFEMKEKDFEAKYQPAEAS